MCEIVASSHNQEASAQLGITTRTTVSDSEEIEEIEELGGGAAEDPVDLVVVASAGRGSADSKF